MRWPLMLKAGVFKCRAGLALLNGAGTQLAASNTNAMQAIWSQVPNPFDVFKAMLLISPVMAGIAGAWVLRLRRQRILSRKRFLFESAMTGMLPGYPLTLSLAVMIWSGMVVQTSCTCE